MDSPHISILIGEPPLSAELKSHLTKKGIVTSTSTPYHPTGNLQWERFNGLTWKNIRLAIRTHNLDVKQWELVLPTALHSLRSLLSTAINCMPHEKFFNFSRRSPAGFSLPSWLVHGPVLLQKFVRASKNDDLVDKVELIDVNPTFASIRYPDGRESTVSLQDLAPCPPDLTQNRVDSVPPVIVNDLNTDCSSPKEMIVHETLSGKASADVRPLREIHLLLIQYLLLTVHMKVFYIDQVEIINCLLNIVLMFYGKGDVLVTSPQLLEFYVVCKLFMQIEREHKLPDKYSDYILW